MPLFYPGRPPSDHAGSFDGHDDLTLLVLHLVEDLDRASVGLAPGRSCRGHGELDREGVARPDRLQPGKLVDSRRAQAQALADDLVDGHPLADGGRMPAARY